MDKEVKMILDTKEDLENLFYISTKQLGYLSFWVNSRKKHIYNKVIIKKRSGEDRILLVPTKRLKDIQRKILEHILPYWFENLTENVTGFIKGKSIFDNAKFHLGKKIILKLDIKNFFPSISQDRVYWMFKKTFNYNHEISSYLSWLCTFRNQIPQWAPTSPAISNIIAGAIDKRIINYLKHINSDISYSRYADDMSISFKDLKKLNIESLIIKITKIVEDEGFFFNIEKTKILTNIKCMKVTGLTINWPNISIWRTNYKKMRSMIHHIKTDWWIKSLQYHNTDNKTRRSLEKFKRIINWKISFINMINPELAKNLSQELKE